MLRLFKHSNFLNVLVGIFLVGSFFLSCAEDDPALTRFVQELLVEIVGGPQDGGTILNNEFFAFEWRGLGSGGDIGYSVQLSGVDASAVVTNETSRSYPGQPAGTYTFTVTATSGSETATDSRTFTVGANLGPPTVVIRGARGSSTSGGTGVTPAYAPGQKAFVQWTAQDVDRFGAITGFRWRIADTEPFNQFNAANVAGFEVPAAPAVYNFTLEAQDNAGAVSSTTFEYEVRAPTIVIVDDNAQGDVLDELDEDQFYADIFVGFAFATWDVAAQGVPTTADLAVFEVAVVYSGVESALWDMIGDDYPEGPVQLSEFIDGGGKIWAMGQGILEDLRFPDGPSNTHDNPPDASEFEATYLHLAAATGDSATDAGLVWTAAGASSGDLKFSFADDVLGDPINFPRITMDVQAGDVDHIVAGAGAEIIYEGKGGLQDVVGDVALRFPSGGTGTEVVFMTFPLFENRSVKASALNSRALAQEIMLEMGQ